MTTLKSLGIRLIITILVLLGLLYLPSPAFSQQASDLQNLIRNGGFEQGFQADYGLGFEWNSFNNGNALVGWSADTWSPVVAAGENAQAIEIKHAGEQDRFAGIYQTVSVVPGQQYKLTIQGLIRSTEGNIEDSNYGYRLQYAIDAKGSTAWELLSEAAWQELPWDEQPLAEPEENNYRIDTFSTTITAESDQLTLFIRGWKKWVNDGSGIFNLDEISLTGFPTNFEVVAAQPASLEAASQTTAPEAEAVLPDIAPQQAEPQAQAAPPEINQETTAPTNNIDTGQTEATTSEALAPAPQQEQLPVSGRGADNTLNYLMIMGLALLLILVSSAIMAVTRRSHNSIK
jgi:hypothetical protein